MCVEEWPNEFMKNTFTIAILCFQYLLPLIVIPSVHSKVCLECKPLNNNNIYKIYNDHHVLSALFIQILNFLEKSSGPALDLRRKEKERQRNKRMTFVLSCIAVTFAVSSLPIHCFFTLTDLNIVARPDPKVRFIP